MGNVNFNTGINKDVQINKNVLFDINKGVQTNVDLSGSLASAQASADAVGFNDGNGAPIITQDFFLLDGGADLQTTVVNSDFPNNRGTAPGTDFPPPIFFPPLPDSETFDDTEIPGARERVFELWLLEPEVAPGLANLRSGVAGVERLGFSNDDFTASNQRIIWQSDTSFSVILPEADLSDPFNALVITDVVFNAGEGIDTTVPATLRVEIEFEDAGGQSESGAVFFTDDPDFGGGFVSGQPIVIPLGTFTGDIPFAQGDLLAPGVVVVDDPGHFNPNLNFEELVRIELRVLDDPDPVDPAIIGSFAFPELRPGENPATGGTDISVDLLGFQSQEIEEVPGRGHFAETDSFAQVTPDGSFSFSEAVAAGHPGVDAFLL